MNAIKWVVLVAIAVVLIVVFTGKDKKDGEMETLVMEENAVLVMDQQPGEETVVSYAKLSKPGYVVVYSTDESGNKAVLGSSTLLSAGEHKNVKVMHSGNSSKKGSRVSAIIVADNGDEIYSEEDAEVLVETSTEESMAGISEEAVLDENISDEDLENLLEDAGYTVEVESSDESDSMMEEEATDDQDQMGEEADINNSVETGTDGTDESTDLSTETTVEVEVQ